MTKVKYGKYIDGENTNYHIKVQGHAGEDVIGKDIVCAAISGLTMAAVEMANISESVIKRDFEISGARTAIELFYTAKTDNREAAMIYEYWHKGIELIAINYPEYVCISD